MASPDLVNGISKRFLSKENIGRTKELLGEQLKTAMAAEDVVDTLEISQLITACEKQEKRYAAPAPKK